jgi:hypothetical protein
MPPRRRRSGSSTYGGVSIACRTLCPGRQRLVLSKHRYPTCHADHHQISPVFSSLGKVGLYLADIARRN